MLLRMVQCILTTLTSVSVSACTAAINVQGASILDLLSQATYI